MLSSVSIAVLLQLRDQISQLRPEQFSQKLAVFNGSSIGGHVRHVVEFFDCLLAGAETGTVNYDARKRDLQIEQNLGYALSIIAFCVEKLEKMPRQTAFLTLESEFGDGCRCAISTSFEREEAYLIEHSIHHFALIRIGIQANWPQTEVCPSFGVAFSTQKFRSEKAILHSTLSAQH